MLKIFLFVVVSLCAGPGRLCAENKNTEKDLLVSCDFNEGSGVNAEDKSGNGNVAALIGATWTKGKEGMALKFNGVDSYADCGTIPGLDDIKAITIEMWVYREREGVTQYLLYQNRDCLGIGDPSGSGRYALFSRYTGKWSLILQSREAAPMNQWTHVVFTWDLENGQANVYYNGVLKASSQECEGEAGSGGSCVIGAVKITDLRGAKIEHPFAGVIDGVRIYSRVLSPEEIEGHALGN